MSTSTIYTVNSTANSVTPTNIIPLGNTVRRFGCNLAQNGNTISLKGRGYYLINAAITLTPTAIGNVGVTMSKDGAAVTGASGVGSVSAVGNSVTIPITAVVRNACDCDSSILSFVLDTTAATVVNIAVSAVKL